MIVGYTGPRSGLTPPQRLALGEVLATLSGTMHNGKRDPRLGIGAPTQFGEGTVLPMWCWLYVDVPVPDPLHPTGRCTCAGEGRCEWCRKYEEPCSLRDWEDT